MIDDHDTKIVLRTICSLAVLCVSLVSYGEAARSDEVIMTTGERLICSNVWEDEGFVHLNMQGLKVKVKREDVATIITGTIDNQQAFRSVGNPILYTMEHSSTVTAKRHPAKASRGANQAESPFSNRFGEKIQTGNDNSLGLPDIYWQMNPDGIPGLKKTNTDPAFGGIDQYTQPDRPMVFGEALLNGWVFSFWQGQLYSIMLWANGRNCYEALRREVFARYGPGKQSATCQECFIWDGHDTQRMLQYDAQLQTAIFIMRSTLMDAHIKQLYPAE